MTKDEEEGDDDETFVAVEELKLSFNRYFPSLDLLVPFEGEFGMIDILLFFI